MLDESNESNESNENEQQESDSEELERCAVCLEYQTYDSIPTECCNKLIHSDCLGKWLAQRNNCPLCRAAQSTYYNTVTNSPHIAPIPMAYSDIMIGVSREFNNINRSFDNVFSQFDNIMNMGVSYERYSFNIRPSIGVSGLAAPDPISYGPIRHYRGWPERRRHRRRGFYWGGSQNLLPNIRLMSENMNSMVDMLNMGVSNSNLIEDLDEIINEDFDIETGVSLYQNNNNIGITFINNSYSNSIGITSLNIENDSNSNIFNINLNNNVRLNVEFPSFLVNLLDSLNDLSNLNQDQDIDISEME